MKDQDKPKDEKYLLVYTSGNGYQCSCCRVEMDKVEEFSSAQELLSFIKSLASQQERFFDFKPRAIYKAVDVAEFYKSDRKQCTEEAIAFAMEMAEQE